MQLKLNASLFLLSTLTSETLALFCPGNNPSLTCFKKDGVTKRGINTQSKQVNYDAGAIVKAFNSGNPAPHKDGIEINGCDFKREDHPGFYSDGWSITANNAGSSEMYVDGFSDGKTWYMCAYVDNDYDRCVCKFTS